MSTLLCTMGSSWAVVPEAFFRRPEGYDRVSVITTEGDAVKVEPLTAFFSEHFPGVALDIARLAGFTDLRDSADHARFEEALYRWYLEQADSGKTKPDVCLAGGFKTMSSAMQQAARLFGAARVFHVQADGHPADAEAILEARREGKIRFIDLGDEEGWPQLRGLLTEDYPLRTVGRKGAARLVAPEGEGLRAEVDRVIEAGRAGSATRDVPFPGLARLPSPWHAWLDEPLDPARDRAWLRALPMAELHCHLGGVATHGPALERVRAAAEDGGGPFPPAPPLPPGWPEPTTPVALDEYMALGDANGSSLLRDPGCLREQVRVCYEALSTDGVTYAEIRCSPGNYASPGAGRSALDVLADIQTTFAACRESALAGGHPYPPRVNLIVIVTRRDGGDLSSLSRHLALAVTAADLSRECRVVGVDLAGFENPSTRPIYFETDFTPAHRCGLAVTVHAGENDDVESIWQAVYRLSARRIGHGLRLGDSPDLLRAVADRGIGVEMCPYANHQIHGFAPMKHRSPYPLLKYLAAGVKVCVNTDNPGISAAGLSENFAFLATLCPGITRREILRLVRNAYEVAFLDQRTRSVLVAEADAAVEQACLDARKR